MPPNIKKTPRKSAYEEMRLKNVEDNKAMLAKLLDDIKGLGPLPKTLKNLKMPKAQKTKRRESAPGPLRRNPRRSSRQNPYSLSPPQTRSRTRRGSVSSGMSDSSSNSSSPQKEEDRLLVRFGTFVNKFDDDDDDDDSYSQRRNSRMYADRDYRTPEEITETDLENVADTGGGKTYDQRLGSTCHQCRQKTIDMKTICRAEDCAGVRGQFCGPCLRNRYGEDARVALKDPKWECPPCRGICNCSICRHRAGKAATGILIHLAMEHGYDNVSSFLASFGMKKE